MLAVFSVFVLGAALVVAASSSDTIFTVSFFVSDIAPIADTKNDTVKMVSEDDAATTSAAPKTKTLKTASISPPVHPSVTKHVAQVERTYHTPRIRVATVKSHTSLDANGLFKLKGAVWVIQLGSF